MVGQKGAFAQKLKSIEKQQKEKNRTSSLKRNGRKNEQGVNNNR